jgi:hypothetical protein
LRQVDAWRIERLGFGMVVPLLANAKLSADVLEAVPDRMPETPASVGAVQVRWETVLLSAHVLVDLIQAFDREFLIVVPWPVRS